MNKQELSKYRFYQREICHQKKRLERIRHKLSKAPEVVADSVKGSSNDYLSLPRVIKITGIEDRTYLECAVTMLEAAIEKNIQESEEALIRIEQFIQTIENPMLREILRGRYIDCYSWEEVARENHYSEPYVREVVRIFLKDLPS